MRSAELLVANETISFVSESMTEMEPAGLWEQTKEALADEALAFGFLFPSSLSSLSSSSYPWGLRFHHHQICPSHC